MPYNNFTEGRLVGKGLAPSVCLYVFFRQEQKQSDILYFVQSDIFDKSKVILKPAVLVLFHSPLNLCEAQYHYEVISLAKQISLAVGE